MEENLTEKEVETGLNESLGEKPIITQKETDLNGAANGTDAAEKTEEAAEEAAENAEETDAADGKTEEEPKQSKRSKGLKQFIQILKFTAFSISAGVIQFVTTGALSTWTNLIPYWIAYLIGLVLSVVWNFTFNRKFTFASASNVPIAMTLVAIYYCMFTPISTFGADAIVESWKVAAGERWNDAFEMVITGGMMILNFVTEFIWDKFLVFNDSVVKKIENLFKRKKQK